MDEVEYLKLGILAISAGTGAWLLGIGFQHIFFLFFLMQIHYVYLLLVGSYLSIVGGLMLIGSILLLITNRRNLGWRLLFFGEVLGFPLILPAILAFLDFKIRKLPSSAYAVWVGRIKKFKKILTALVPVFGIWVILSPIYGYYIILKEFMPPPTSFLTYFTVSISNTIIGIFVILGGIIQFKKPDSRVGSSLLLLFGFISVVFGSKPYIFLVSFVVIIVGTLGIFARTQWSE